MEMTAKNEFIEQSYQKVMGVIQEIPDDIAHDIYALSFWLTNAENDYRYPTLILGYNTLTNFQAEKGEATDDLEYKWNFAYWLVDDMGKIGGEDDKFLTAWFEQTPHFYSQEQEDLSEENDEVFAKIVEKGEQFQAEFIQIVIQIAQRLFTEKVLEQKFGKNIPIIIHDLEYYEDPINWTTSANPPELIKEFLTFANDD